MAATRRERIRELPPTGGRVAGRSSPVIDWGQAALEGCPPGLQRLDRDADVAVAARGAGRWPRTSPAPGGLRPALGAPGRRPAVAPDRVLRLTQLEGLCPIWRLTALSTSHSPRRSPGRVRCPTAPEATRGRSTIGRDCGGF